MARCGRGTPHSSRAPCAPARCAPASSAEHVGRLLARAPRRRRAGKLLSCTLCRSISAASASALSRSISASANAASVAQACATIAFSSASSASQALQRHDAFAGAVRLVEAGAVIDRRDAIEAERDVGAGADEFGGVEHAGLQAGEDLAGRRRLRRRAEPAIALRRRARASGFSGPSRRRGLASRGGTSRPCTRRYCRP